MSLPINLVYCAYRVKPCRQIVIRGCCTAGGIWDTKHLVKCLPEVSNRLESTSLGPLYEALGTSHGLQPQVHCIRTGLCDVSQRAVTTGNVRLDMACLIERPHIYGRAHNSVVYCRCSTFWSPGSRSRRAAGSCPNWTMRPAFRATARLMHLLMPMKPGGSLHTSCFCTLRSNDPRLHRRQPWCLSYRFNPISRSTSKLHRTSRTVPRR